MGCNCECHDKLDKIGVHGCCWKCEADHDSLHNALLQLSEKQKQYDIACNRIEAMERGRIVVNEEIEKFREECARARIAWRDPKMDSSHTSLFIALLDKYGKGPITVKRNDEAACSCKCHAKANHCTSCGCTH